MEVRGRLLDAIHRSLKEGNYRPTEAEVLESALAGPEELGREFGSFSGLVEYFALSRSEDVLRHAVSGVQRVAIPEYTALALAWVLLTGRRHRPGDRMAGAQW